MDECNDGSLATRTGCILTYSGSTNDIIINYIVFVVDLVACYVVDLPSRQQPLPSPRLVPVICFGFVILFQIVLCWILACSGISIIWCAMCGWLIMKQRRQQRQQQQQRLLLQEPPQDTATNKKAISFALFLGVMLLNFGVIIYYAVVAPVITTVAHVAAIVLGILLSFLSGLSIISRLSQLLLGRPHEERQEQQATEEHQEQQQPPQHSCQAQKMDDAGNVANGTNAQTTPSLAADTTKEVQKRKKVC